MIPFISEGIPGIGGRLRQEAEDFVVREVPGYEPTGSGEHLFIEVTKKNLTTEQVRTALVHCLGITSDDVGYAGKKDRMAITTQLMSIPSNSALEKLADIQEQVQAEYPNCALSVTPVAQHDQKLRIGHLSGNRFTIRVRQANRDWPALVEQTQQALAALGVANFFGLQRFGRRGDNARFGENAVRGKFVAGPKWQRRLLVSAFQSELFNRYLSWRIRDGLFGRALVGDVFGRLPSGGVFLSRDPQAEQPRLDSFEISPMGPIFGYKMMKCAEQAAEREEQVLRSIENRSGAEVSATEDGEVSALAQITLEDFRKAKAKGSRRRFRLAMPQLGIEEFEGDPVFSFELPSGSYATVFLNEFMKTDSLGCKEREIVDD